MSRSREEDADDDVQQRPRKRQNTQADEQNFFKHHQPGFIRSVECINFMCHKNLKVNVGSGITFVSGQNGHGKSAILTALIQVFSTDRRMKGERGTGSALRRNIEGDKKAKSAKIIVKIQNKRAEEELDLVEGGNRGYTMKPFEPETYGDIIIVEREIFDKSKKLRIMSEDKEVISEKNEVLLKIMRHFSYQFDNRLVIQTQENAKKRGEPKSLFDFFYNGSGFESIETDLAKMESEVAEQKECIETSMVPSTQQKKQRRDQLKAECELTAHTKELHDELQRFEAMFKWLEYSVVQKSLNDTLSMKVRLEDRCTQFRGVAAKRQVELEEQRVALENCEKGDPELDAQVNDAIKRKARLKTEYEDNKSQIRSSTRDVEDLESQIKILNHAIGKLRSERDNSNSNAEHERMDAKIQECEEKIREAEASLSSVKADLEEKKNAWRDAKSKTQDASSPRNQKESQLRDAKDEANRLEAMAKDKGNPIAGFGHQFVEGDRIIQANRNRFKLPPLGPIGQYIKIKPGTREQDVKLINSHQPLTRLLKAYVVGSPEDERTLRGLLPRNYNPTIYYVKPDNYDVERVSPSPQFKTVLRCLDISEARVVQALVEWASVHNTALAGSTEEAVRALKQGAQNLDSMLAPHRTSSQLIVTASQRGSQLASSRVQPIVLRVGKVSVTAEEVAAAQKRVAICERELRPLVEEIGRLEQEERQALREFRALEDKEQKMSDRFRALRKQHAYAVSEKESIPDAPSTDETDQAIDAKTQEVDNSKQQLAEAREALQNAEKRAEELRNNAEEVQSEIRELGQRKQKLIDAVEEVKVAFAAHQEVMTNTNQKLQLAERKLAEKEAQLVELQATMETALAGAQALSEEHVHLDDGVEFERGFDYCTNNSTKIKKKIQAAQERNLRDYRVVYAEFQEAEDAYRQAKVVYDAQSKEVRALAETRTDRNAVKNHALSLGIAQTSTHFRNVMKTKAASADISIDLDTKKLEVKNYKLASSSGATSSGGARDVATTSGGEHSFLQSALMSALWRMVDAPIICLDEYEVFMDDATRVTAQKNLVTALSSLKQRAQAILISPTVVKNTNADDPRFVYVEVRDPALVNATE